MGLALAVLLGVGAAAVGDAAARFEGRTGGAGEPTCIVERVIDGDTFVCAGGERVRLLLIDAPEMDQPPFGASSKSAAEDLLPVGAVARLELDVDPRDRFGRLLAYAWVDSTLVNRALVRRGMAVVAVYPPNVRHVEAFRAASDSARAEGAGLWGRSGFECLPADHRADRCP